MGKEPDYDVILHVSDWNLEDRYYQLKESQLKTLKKRIEEKGIRKAWDWLTARVNYGDKPNPKKPIKYGTVNMTLESFFLDYMDPEDSMIEWEGR